MNILIPVKRLDRAKSRLASVLPEAPRRALVLEMLDHVLEVSQSAGAVYVVTVDPEAQIRAEQHGASIIASENDYGLVPALSGARVALGVGDCLILPADLPLIESGDVRMLAETGRTSGRPVVVPCRYGQGTNALYLPMETRGALAFGTGSFRKHMANLVGPAGPALSMTNSRIGFDVDSMSDLTSWPRLAAAA